MNRLDIIAKILLEALEHGVDPDAAGFVYRIEGGRRDGRETLIESSSRHGADALAREKGASCGGKLTFVRKQTAGATSRHETPASPARSK